MGDAGKMVDEDYLALALAEATESMKEGGIPIGAVLVSKDGEILGRGRNERVQKGSAILHAEMAALENSGRLPGHVYKGATMYTTLSPCDMCSGACFFYGIARVVLGENNTRLGAESFLKEKGVQVVNVNNRACEELMKTFIEKSPDLWNEDIAQ